jgi:hypothetical protein
MDHFFAPFNALGRARPQINPPLAESSSITTDLLSNIRVHPDSSFSDSTYSTPLQDLSTINETFSHSQATYMDIREDVTATTTNTSIFLKIITPYPHQ